MRDATTGYPGPGPPLTTPRGSTPGAGRARSPRARAQARREFGHRDPPGGGSFNTRVTDSSGRGAQAAAHQVVEQGAVGGADAEELDPHLVLVAAAADLVGDAGVDAHHPAVEGDGELHQRAEADRPLAHQHAAAGAQDLGLRHRLGAPLAEDAQADRVLGADAGETPGGQTLARHLPRPPYS